jgi:hypothetical protein
MVHAADFRAKTVRNPSSGAPFNQGIELHILIT